MHIRHAKTVRRHLLHRLYQAYIEDPLQVLSPEEVLDDLGITREELVPNIHYLADRGLVELTMGYRPPLFASARITADGIDVVEDEYEFNRRFPAAPVESETGIGALPHLVERLFVEAELSAVDGEARRAMIRDVQYLRDELARPSALWRPAVIQSVLGWIDAQLDGNGETLDALEALRTLLEENGSLFSR